MRPYCFLIIAITLAGIAWPAPPAAGQTSFPMVWATYPSGAQRGTTTVVTVYAGGSEGGGGGNLYGAYKALFQGEGVRAEIIPPKDGWPKIDPKKPYELPAVDNVQMRVTVSPDAALGVREFRIGTPRFGISTVGLFVIGDEPEVAESEPNNDIEHAQAVSVPCVVNGRLQETEDVDTFKFKAAAGQQIVFTALCARLEDKIHDLNVHADPLLILRDLKGAELARNDDYYGADPLLAYKFDRAGEYVVQIRDVNYHGDAHWVYRLTMTTRPYVVTALPCAVQPGKHADLRVTGFNLGDTHTVGLDVPAGVPPGLWETPLKFPNGTSNLVRLLVSTVPQSVPESKPAAGAGSGTITASFTSAPAAVVKATLMPPCAINACLAVEGQPDRYRFHARKGEGWGFEVTARRLDSAMDSELKVRDAKGALLASNDDAFGKDSRLDWTAPEEGDYTLDVSDVAGQAGPNCFYNLTADLLRPDFRLQCDPDRAMIAPGNRTAWYVLLDRKYGYAGEVKVEVKGLPPGVTVSSLTIPPNVPQAAIILSAAPDARIDAANVEIVGSATLPGPDGKPKLVSRTVHPLMEIYSPGGGRSHMEVETQGVSVTEPNDVQITADTDHITLAPGGTAKIGVTIRRWAGYTKPVTLDVVVQHQGDIQANPLPPGVTVDDGASKTLLNGDDTKGYITLRAAADAQPVKDLPLAALANVSINFVMKVWYASQPLYLTVTPPAKK